MTLNTSTHSSPSSVHDLGPSAEAMPDAASVSAVSSGVTVAGAFGQGSADAPRDSFYPSLAQSVIAPIALLVARDLACRDPYAGLSMGEWREATRSEEE